MVEKDEKICPQWPECGCSEQGQKCGISMPTTKPEGSRGVLVKEVLERVQAGEKYHQSAFGQMKRDMDLAADGHGDEWEDEWYVANIVQRHIQQRTAALYAKNPKAVAKRRDRMDYSVWDENPRTLERAMMGVQAQMSIGDPTRQL